MTTPQWRPPPTGPRRWFYRLPLLAFRMHLGWVFGHRLVMLVHRGERPATSAGWSWRW